MKKNLKILPIEDYHPQEEFFKQQWMQTIFLDKTWWNLAIDFYNKSFGYKEHPISSEEALMYAELGTRINADLFKILHPRDEVELDYFYQMTPFHFFNNVLRFMDGYHRALYYDILEKQQSPFLDFGGGTGGISIQLAAKGWDVTFCDSNVMCKKWIEYVNSQLGLKIHVINIGEKIERKFKFILAKDIIEHVVDPLRLNGYLNSLLDEGGNMNASHFPCCGPEELAPMHFKVGYKKNESGDSGVIYANREHNLELLRTGKYPDETKPSNSVLEPQGQEVAGASKVD